MGNRDLSLLQQSTAEKYIILKDKVKENFGYDIFITDGFRTAEEQFSLYQKGRTKPGRVVTYVDGYKNKSNHQFGIAFDIAFNGNELYPKEHQKRENVASIARGLGLEWGFDLWGFDKPHFQNTGKETHISEQDKKNLNLLMRVNGLFRDRIKIQEIRKILHETNNYIREALDL